MGKAERFNWFRQLVEWQQEGTEKDHNDYLASIKEDLFDEEVFVITPKGDVVGLGRDLLLLILLIEFIPK